MKWTSKEENYAKVSLQKCNFNYIKYEHAHLDLIERESAGKDQQILAQQRLKQEVCIIQLMFTQIAKIFS